MEKRENTLGSKVKREAKGLIGGVAISIVSFLIAWALGLIGFK